MLLDPLNVGTVNLTPRYQKNLRFLLIHWFKVHILYTMYSSIIKTLGLTDIFNKCKNISIRAWQVILDGVGLSEGLGEGRQDVYRPGVSLADATILCTALGGDHNKDLMPLCCEFTEFVFTPPWNRSTYIAYHNLRRLTCTDIILGGRESIYSSWYNIGGFRILGRV